MMPPSHKQASIPFFLFILRTKRFVSHTYHTLRGFDRLCFYFLFSFFRSLFRLSVDRLFFMNFFFFFFFFRNFGTTPRFWFVFIFGGRPSVVQINILVKRLSVVSVHPPQLSTHSFIHISSSPSRPIYPHTNKHTPYTRSPFFSFWS